VQAFIRFVGVVNAAIWLGSAVFYTLAAGPAFFSSEMLSFLPRPHAGRAAEIVLHRYYLIHQWCAAIALLHLLLEYLYTGRPVDRVNVGLLSGLFTAALVGGHWLLPHLHGLQRIRYSPAATPAQQLSAANAFGLLHGFSQVLNVLMIIAILYYLWSLSRPLNTLRFTSFGKIRS